MASEIDQLKQQVMRFVSSIEAPVEAWRAQVNYITADVAPSGDSYSGFLIPLKDGTLDTELLLSRMGSAQNVRAGT